MEDGLAAPEASKNATTGTALIPLLTLGIPGSAGAAIMLAALILHGVQPGPHALHEEPGHAVRDLRELHAGQRLHDPRVGGRGALLRRADARRPGDHLRLHRRLQPDGRVRRAQQHRRRLHLPRVRRARLLHAPLRLSHRADGARRDPRAARRGLFHDLDGELQRRPHDLLHAAEERRADGARRRFVLWALLPELRALAAAARWKPEAWNGFNPSRLRLVRARRAS